MEAYASAHELRYVNFLELQEETGIDYSTDTYDGGLHMNLSGAEKLSVYFGRILSGEMGVPDRRGETELSLSWEEKLAAFGTDCNGDGKVVVQLKQYLASYEDAMYNAAANVRLLADLDGRESYFFLLEDPEKFQADYEVLEEDWFPVAGGLYLARRAVWGDRTAEHMEEYGVLWARLLEEAS